MRKNFLFFLGSLTGIGLTLLVTGPEGEHLIARARAAAGAADTYSQLNLFGEVFERVRSDYVEKPNDPKLMEGAINGMVSSLDPHSRYMNDKAWREMQETTNLPNHSSSAPLRHIRKTMFPIWRSGTCIPRNGISAAPRRITSRPTS